MMKLLTLETPLQWIVLSTKRLNARLNLCIFFVDTINYGQWSLANLQNPEEENILYDLPAKLINQIFRENIPKRLPDNFIVDILKEIHTARLFYAHLSWLAKN